MSCSEIGIENSRYFLQQSSTERRIITNLATRACRIMRLVCFDLSLVSWEISFGLINRFDYPGVKTINRNFLCLFFWSSTITFLTLNSSETISLYFHRLKFKFLLLVLSGFVQVLKNLFWHFQGLESPGKKTIGSGESWKFSWIRQ